VTVVVNGKTATYYYGQSDTATSVANGLVSALNSAGMVTASIVTGTCCSISMQSKTPISTMYAFSTSSTTNVPQYVSSPSFYANPSSGTMTPEITNPTATYYKYDALGNLTGVVQGSQTRTWTYDGLSRLTSESVPEISTTANGTTVQNPITFSYANSTGKPCSGNPSNPCSKRAPATNQTGSATVTTTYVYDTANRITSRCYSDSTACVTFTYKTSANGKGLMASMTDPSGSETYSYDKMKRVTQVAKKIGSTTYTTSYTYNTAGQLTKITYPSGRVVWYNYDGVGHLCQVATASSTSCGAATAYLNLPSLQYDPAGRPLSATYGNGVAATVTYDPKTFSLTSLSYTKGSTTLFGLKYYYQQDSTNCATGNSAGNTGQIQCITDTVQPGRSVAYTYDSIGRLSTAVTSGSTAYPKWGLSETYDRYGNRTAQGVTAGTGPNLSLSISAVTNQVTTFSYDAAGNVIGEAPPTETFSYDHDECYTGNSNGATYTCDGNRMRVQKVLTGTGAVNTVYVRAGDQVLAEYDNGAAVTSPTREYLYANELLAVVTGSTAGSGGTITYQQRDHLSPRLLTDSNGNDVGEEGTFPFGESWYSSTAAQGMVFTTYERDSETGNDYAVARSYADTLGRFMSPDPAEGRVGDPQSWNRYAYVENDPINLADPSGQGFWADLGLAIATIFVDIFLPELAPAMTAVDTTEEGTNTVLILSQTIHAIDGGYIAVKITTVSGTGTECTSASVCNARTQNGNANSTSSTSSTNGGPGATTGTQDAGAGSQGPSGSSGGTAGGGPGTLPNGDVPVGMDIWRNSPACPNCGGIWKESQDFVYDFAKSEAIEAAGGAIFEGVAALRIGSKVAKEGIYEFASSTGETYVGQSGNIAKRITQHLKSGKLLPQDLGTVRTTEVAGGKLMREIAEQLRIDELGGIKYLRNIKNPIGNGAAPLLRALMLEF
jgi:RHS repeat-associated protein